jgi:hypothetical protein
MPRRHHVIPQQSILPSGYTRLNYIEGTGTQYIDTSLSAANGFDFECAVIFTRMFAGDNTYQPYIVGSHNMSYPYGRNGVQIDYNSFFQLGLGDTYPRCSTQATENTKYMLKGSTVKGASYLSINGNVVISSADSSARSSNPLFVFYNQWEYNANRRKSYIRLDGEMILTINGVRHELIPALRCVDNKPGLYSVSQDVFLVNAGSGEFLFG